MQNGANDYHMTIYRDYLDYHKEIMLAKVFYHKKHYKNKSVTKNHCKFCDKKIDLFTFFGSNWLRCVLATSITVSSTCNSSSVGITYQYFWSSASTALMTCCCSTNRETISYVEPHLVLTSIFNFCSGIPSSSCFSVKLRDFFQLRWNTCTTE